MATYVWNGDTSGSLATSTNYSPNGSPGNNDTVIFDGAVNVDTALNTFDSNTGMTFIVRRTYTGRIGSSGSPLQAGTGTTVRVDGTASKGSYWDIQTATRFEVLGGNPTAPCVLEAGTYTLLVIASRRVALVEIGSVTVTEGDFLDFGGEPLINVAAGATMTLCRWFSGQGTWATGGTIQIYGGHVDFTGATKTIASCELRSPLAAAKVTGNNLTFTSLIAYKGELDASEAGTVVVTAGRAYPGGKLDLDNGQNTVTGAVTKRGGMVLHRDALTVTSDVSDAA